MNIRGFLYFLLGFWCPFFNLSAQAFEADTIPQLSPSGVSGNILFFLALFSLLITIFALFLKWNATKKADKFKTLAHYTQSLLESLVKSFVQLHEGTVVLKAAEDQETIITCTLPRIPKDYEGKKNTSSASEGSM
jgi:hypothetical protein